MLNFKMIKDDNSVRITLIYCNFVRIILQL